MDTRKKTCALCYEEKPIDGFGFEARALDQRNPRCKKCNRDYVNARNARHPHKTRLTANALKAKKVRLQRDYAQLRLEVVAAYGGKCVCCDESTVEFLSIDHVRNDGAEERGNKSTASNSRGYGLYRRLKSEGFPRDRYQLLCYNCNYAKGRCGICPHQRGKEVPPNLQGVFRSPLRAESSDLVM